MNRQGGERFPTSLHSGIGEDWKALLYGREDFSLLLLLLFFTVNLSIFANWHVFPHTKTFQDLAIPENIDLVLQNITWQKPI